jgi:AAA domain
VNDNDTRRPARPRLVRPGQAAEAEQAAREQHPAVRAAKVPWSPASMVADRQGLNMALFALPGAGKTTLGASATDSKQGAPLLVVNFDCETRSISDRDDIMVWPGEEMGGQIESWKQIDEFTGKLLRMKHPFKSIMFDTMGAGYDFAYRHVTGKSSNRRDGRQEFGEANQLILDLVSAWAVQSREQGINVIFSTHAEEKDETIGTGPTATKVTKLRMSVTPGVVKGMYQRVSTIGYLDERSSGERRLILHNTVKVIAKVHQPRSGTPLDLEIKDPNLGTIIDHFKKPIEVRT